MPSVVVEFLDDAAFDSVQALPDPHLDIAWELLEHLQTNPYYGKNLEARVETGDLSDTRTLYVIDFEQEEVEWPPPYRIVYRLLPDEKAPAKAQVVWAGPRDDLEVYKKAAKRLGR
jgi:hypothetical protein